MNAVARIRTVLDLMRCFVPRDWPSDVLFLSACLARYYNQGPWEVQARHRLDDWSNTWIGLHYSDKTKGRDLKYVES